MFYNKSLKNMSINIQCTTTNAVNGVPGSQNTHPGSHARNSLSPAWRTELKFIALWVTVSTSFS